MEYIVEDVDPRDRVNPLDLFCSSIDTLRGTRIDHTIPANSGWSDSPTKLSGLVGDGPGLWRYAIGGGGGENDDERETVRRMCRAGVPPSLRCAAWIINAASSPANIPRRTRGECDEYGTLGKVRVLDHGWEVVLRSVFPDESDLDRADVLDFGAGRHALAGILRDDHGGEPIPDGGVRSLTRVMHAARDSIGVEFCPLLPDVACLLLSYMPESYAYATIRQMVGDDSSYFLAVSNVQHLAWCMTFADLMRRYFPETAMAMQKIGALTTTGLDPILKRFFVPLLRREHVLRVMDIYSSEGRHAIFRIGCSLCSLCHDRLGDRVRADCPDAATFWEGVRRFVRSNRFDFDAFLEELAYGRREGPLRILSWPIFPNAECVDRIAAENDAWAKGALQNASFREDTKPLGLVEGNAPVVLARDSSARLNLARWLPPVMRSTKIDLVYSSNVHGRSIEMFYRCCAASRHTIVTMEVLDRPGVVLGMYATQTWHNNPKGYGDGECCFFRLRPNPECFRYRSRAGRQNNRGNDAGQLMISGDKFLSMGVGEDGASGIRLNEDLTRGSTSKSAGGFDNDDELIGEGVQVFDVGLVEVYRLIREVDGRPVDGVEDPWKGMFD